MAPLRRETARSWPGDTRLGLLAATARPYCGGAQRGDSILRLHRIVNTILGSLALLAPAVAALPGFAATESLTRPSCWTATLHRRPRQTLSFAGSRRPN